MIFGKNGGLIVPEKEVKIILPTDRSKVTSFRRHGMVYRMDAWVRKADVQKKKAGFQRHAP